MILAERDWLKRKDYLEILTPILKAQGIVLLNLFCSAWVTQQMLQQRENVDVG